MQIHPNSLTVPFRRLAELIEEKSGPGITATRLMTESINQLCDELTHFVNSGKANKTTPEKMTTDDLKR